MNDTVVQYVRIQNYNSVHRLFYGYKPRQDRQKGAKHNAAL